MQPALSTDFPEMIFDLYPPTEDQLKTQTSFTAFNYQFFKYRLANAILRKARLDFEKNTAYEFALIDAEIAVWGDLLSLVESQFSQNFQSND